MTTPNTPASPEQEGERCPDCRRLVGRLAWRADGAYATDGECLARVSRAGPLYREECKDRTITHLRIDLATLQAKLDALVAEAQTAVERSDRSAPKERDNISRNTLAEDLGRALLRAKAGL